MNDICPVSRIDEVGSELISEMFWMTREPHFPVCRKLGKERLVLTDTTDEFTSIVDIIDRVRL